MKPVGLVGENRWQLPLNVFEKLAHRKRRRTGIADGVLEGKAAIGIDFASLLVHDFADEQIGEIVEDELVAIDVRILRCDFVAQPNENLGQAGGRHQVSPFQGNTGACRDKWVRGARYRPIRGHVKAVWELVDEAVLMAVEPDAKPRLRLQAEVCFELGKPLVDSWRLAFGDNPDGIRIALTFRRMKDRQIDG